MPEKLQQMEEWLPLSKAAERLNVHPTTLRRWADNGEIPVMLTPGGHRRFAAADLMMFAEERHGLQNTDDLEQIWANEALSQTRQEITVHQDTKWLANFDEEGRARHRRLGQQLMGLTMRFLAGEEDDDQLLEQARQIGQEYATIALETDLRLTDALRAAIFFRDTLVETALHLPENAHVRPEASMQLLRRINTLLNAVHLSIAEEYDAPDKDSLSRS
ncbi:MAG: helix-turn-helix domain-containing protein [Candidatus Promineifilaceae bacterium]|nr:helix-turn-helix domain-containing protein [Candidatus Promineifilaceae bacterium]